MLVLDRNWGVEHNSKKNIDNNYEKIKTYLQTSTSRRNYIINDNFPYDYKLD